MDQQGMPMALVIEAGLGAGDCYNDAETVDKTGKLCKVDTPCSSGNICVLFTQHAYIPTTQISGPLPVATALIAAVDPSVVWRPPLS